MLVIRGLFELAPCKVCGTRTILANKEYGLCYMCHRKLNDVFEYSTVNDEHRGHRKARSWSIELEVEESPVSLSVALMKAKYVPTQDASLGEQGVEWKSPIYHSRPIYRRDLQEIEPYSYLIGPRCGTHIHVGIRFFDAMMTAQRYLKETLMPLSMKLQDDRSVTAKVWGRFFNGYADPNLDFIYHHNWVSLSFRTKKTLEWRLPKFRNAQQFYAITMFVIDTTKVLDRLAGYVTMLLNYGQQHLVQRVVNQTSKVIMKRYDKTVETIISEVTR